MKVLHIEDNINDHVLLEKELTRAIGDIEFRCVENENGLHEALSTFLPDIVISDYFMPSFDGMSALKICKAHNPRLPFIILTGSMNEDTAVDCLKAGADDYVIKEHIQRISTAVLAAIELQKLTIEKENNNKALIESEHRLALALEGANAGIWDLIIPSGIIYLGGTLFEKLGYDKAEISENPSEFRKRIINKEDFSAVDFLLKQYVSGAIPSYESEYRIARKDGSFIHVLERGKIIERDENGTAIRVVGTIIDITEKKKTETDLRIAKEKAEEMNRLKTNFLSNMSHEFRTPLNGILGMATILTEMTPEPDKNKMLFDIIFSGKRLQNTLDSILEYAQLDSSFNASQLRDVDIKAIAADRIKECSVLSRQKNIPIILKSSDEPIYVKATEKYISIILYNLLENSLKFTSQGQISIDLSIELKNGIGWGVIKVSDTGIGILKEHQDLIFHEFRQVSEGYGRYYEGAGLGLALVKKLTDLLNGTVSVESEYGVGSTFVVKIPVNVLETVKPEKQINEISTNIISAAMEKKRVLLIEDNPVNKDVVALFLKKYCDVDFANTGERGIMLARKYLYPAVIVDINLGSGMNGVEAAREIRKIEGYEKTPVIAVTGYAMHGDKEKLLSEGMDYYLAKPFEKIELIKIVLEAINR